MDLDHKTIFEEFSERQVEVLVVGGLAVNLYEFSV